MPSRRIGSWRSVISCSTAAIGSIWRTARLYVREEAKLDVDRSGDLLTTNKVRMRLEGRYGVAFNRPGAFAAVDLSAWHLHGPAASSPPRPAVQHGPGT